MTKQGYTGKFSGQNITASLAQLTKINICMCFRIQTQSQWVEPLDSLYFSQQSPAVCQAMRQRRLASALLPDSDRSWRQQHHGDVWWHQAGTGPNAKENCPVEISHRGGDSTQRTTDGELGRTLHCCTEYVMCNRLFQKKIQRPSNCFNNVVASTFLETAWFYPFQNILSLVYSWLENG